LPCPLPCLAQAAELDHIGGAVGQNLKPTPFMCLTLKLLQIQPDKEIIIEYIKQEDYKYLRALGAFYLRLTGSAMDIYNYLEPLYNDYRKLRRRIKSGRCSCVSQYCGRVLAASLTVASTVGYVEGGRRRRV